MSWWLASCTVHALVISSTQSDIAQGYMYSRAARLIGVEKNGFFAAQQRAIVSQYRFGDRATIVEGDIADHAACLHDGSDRHEIERRERAGAGEGGSSACLGRSFEWTYAMSGCIPMRHCLVLRVTSSNAVEGGVVLLFWGGVFDHRVDGVSIGSMSLHESTSPPDVL